MHLLLTCLGATISIRCIISTPAAASAGDEHLVLPPHRSRIPNKCGSKDGEPYRRWHRRSFNCQYSYNMPKGDLLNALLAETRVVVEIPVRKEIKH